MVMKTMVEVFKTNIHKLKQAKQVLNILTQHFPACKINIDLKDCDRVLRVEGHHLSVQTIIDILQLNGYQCQVLE